jgi:hypothetical protein
VSFSLIIISPSIAGNEAVLSYTLVDPFTETALPNAGFENPVIAIQN